MLVDDAELAMVAAQAGAAVVRARFGTSLQRFAKSGHDFATVADIEAEKAIVEVLRTARPDDAVIGEESGASGPGVAGRTWLVDPLCGTLNFAARNMLVAVNVALRVGADVTASATVDPFADEVFWTDRDRAQVRHAGVDSPLAPSAESRLVDVDLAPPHPNSRWFRAARLLADDDFAEHFLPRVVSTSLALVWVAAGRRAGYVADCELVDNVHFASGIALCQAAGCVVTDLRGEPVRSGGTTGLVVSADPEVHAALLAAIGKQLPPG
ncbi:inositol monophosphatase family protein [Solwaraspora sp. WMMD1047]|uniref:inositol monophosphatase family protein n=1 Tax=Solwaraspora sp. WMMD1047 TaxID=3016102 RepID=UPI00241709B6|nr:inositol monophosphatase family protein [Solwaraspora sp. WMMD1047]MDG4828990.1 inositol monophosphatase family protein [Solwaraspora sp. WMMD1047]